MTTTRYHEIAATLRHDVQSGVIQRGQRLPSEAALCDRFGVSRVTVRRALELLKAEGLAESRRGFGWMTTVEPFRAGLASLSTIERQLLAAGARSERRVIAFGFTAASGQARELFGETQVLEVTRLHLADGEPFARVTVWCPDRIGARLSRADVEAASFLDQLSIEVGGAVQTIGAAACDERDAELLDVPVDAPILLVRRVTSALSGEPLLVSEHAFPGHRMQFVVELPADDGTLPPGFRLLTDPARPR